MSIHSEPAYSTLNIPKWSSSQTTDSSKKFSGPRKLFLRYHQLEIKEAKMKIEKKEMCSNYKNSKTLMAQIHSGPWRYILDS